MKSKRFTEKGFDEKEENFNKNVQYFLKYIDIIYNDTGKPVTEEQLLQRIDINRKDLNEYLEHLKLEGTIFSPKPKEYIRP